MKLNFLTLYWERGRKCCLCAEQGCIVLSVRHVGLGKK